MGIISLPWALLVQGVVLVLYKVRAINLSILFFATHLPQKPQNNRRNSTNDTRAPLQFHSGRRNVTLTKGAGKILKFSFWNLGRDFRFSLGRQQTSEVAQDAGTASAPRGQAEAEATCHDALPEVLPAPKVCLKGYLQETGCVTHAARSISSPRVAAH